MSPSEFDLRSALHDGDDEPLDIDRIVAGGRAKAAARRTQILTAVVAAAFVGVAATTGVVLANRDDGTTTTTADAGSASTNLPLGAPKGAGGAAATGAPRDAASPSSSPSSAPSTQKGGLAAPTDGFGRAVACPGTLPRLTIPARPTDTPLFAAPSRSIVVCAYGNPLEARIGGGTPGRSVLTGPDALQLQTSLESAARTPANRPCPTVPLTARRELAFIPIDPTGAVQSPITTTLSAAACNLIATDGKTVRYDWTPPAPLLARLLTLDLASPPTGGAPRPSPSGRNFGSPVR